MQNVQKTLGNRVVANSIITYESFETCMWLLKR